MRIGVYLAAVPVLVSACSISTGSKPPANAVVGAPPAVSIAVTPAAGSVDIEPDDAVTVSATNGRLTDVQVKDSDGLLLDGEYGADRSTWTAGELLRLAETYTVLVTGVDAQGTTVRESSEFATLDIPESEQLRASTIAPLDGSTVGVAQPLVVGFNFPVRDKQAVQAALRVETSKAVEGAWYMDRRPVRALPTGRVLAARHQGHAVRRRCRNQGWTGAVGRG